MLIIFFRFVQTIKCNLIELVMSLFVESLMFHHNCVTNTHTEYFLCDHEVILSIKWSISFLCKLRSTCIYYIILFSSIFYPKISVMNKLFSRREVVIVLEDSCFIFHSFVGCILFIKKII